MERILEFARRVFALDAYDVEPVSAHEGGRNIVYVCRMDGEKRRILRISMMDDRTEEDYLAETEFVHYLAQNGAPVADVCASVHGRYVECCMYQGKKVYISLFVYAKGMILADNRYRYREGSPIEEYFYNTGKASGKIHRISKQFTPQHHRIHYFDKYNMEYINKLIPETYASLRLAIAQRLQMFRSLPVGSGDYGLVHFDFSDGNYHIDMSNGQITVFDFDNCMYCWYIYDLANLWTHGVGWCRSQKDAAKRLAYMEHYFATVLDGYRSETDVAFGLLEKLQLFIDMVLIENIVDEFECCIRENVEVDYEDIEVSARCLIEDIPWAGVGIE